MVLYVWLLNNWLVDLNYSFNYRIEGTKTQKLILQTESPCDKRVNKLNGSLEIKKIGMFDSQPCCSETRGLDLRLSRNNFYYNTERTYMYIKQHALRLFHDEPN